MIVRNVLVILAPARLVGGIGSSLQTSSEHVMTLGTMGLQTNRSKTSYTEAARPQSSLIPAKVRRAVKGDGTSIR